MPTSSKSQRRKREDKAQPRKQGVVPSVSDSLFCRPRIFLASSGKALSIAKRLKSRLDKIADVIPWWKGFAAGGTTLSTLLDHARNCDFAVVLFTPDDKLNKNGKKSLAPRDNCIFELGLFMGALGLEPKRALLLRGDSKEPLLSDLAGLTYIELPSTNGPRRGGRDRNADVRVINQAMEQIKNNIKDLRYCFNHPTNPGPLIIPKERLMDLESIDDGGNLLTGNTGEVLINTTQPIELNHKLAETVCKNMNADVAYSYFFKADATSMRFFSSLVGTLAAACIDSQDSSHLNSDGWKKLMEEKPDDVTKILETMKKYLRIYFLPKKPSIEFCVHNANHRNEAICYLRYSADTFVEWFRGENAKYLADQLRTACCPAEEKVVFQNSLGYELYSQANRDFLNQLIENTLGQFPDSLRDDVKKTCFGCWN